MKDDKVQASGAAAGTAAEDRASRGLLSRTLLSAIDFWVQQATALLVFIVVGNIVGPAAVGVLTLAQLGVTLAMTLLIDGFSDALIQRQRLEPAHFNTAFALLAGIGFASGLALWLLAPAAATLFGQPDLGWIMPLLAIGLPLLGMAVPYQALLQRQMRFGALALRSLVAQGVGFAVALALALSGSGVQALIAYVLIVRALDTLMLALLAGRLPGLTLSRQALADIVDFGKHRMGNQVLGFVVTQIDRVTAGLFLGAVTIGLFSLAERIANALTGGLSGVVERVGFSAFSARQSEPEALRQTLKDVLFLANLLAMPAFIGLAAVSRDIVAALFSAEWTEAAPVLALLALAGIPHATNYVFTAAINARGRPDLALRYSVVIMTLRLAASLISAPYGIVALAAMNLAVTTVSTGMVLLVVRRHLPGAPGLAARGAVRPALAAMGMVLAIEALALVLPVLAPSLLLAAKIAIGAAAYAGLLLLLAPQDLRRLARGSI